MAGRRDATQSRSLRGYFHARLSFFSGAWAGAGGQGHVGAGVSRRQRAFHRVCMGVRLSGCACVRVRWCLLFCFCSSHSRRAQHNMIGPIRRLFRLHRLLCIFRSFCAPAVRHGVVLDVFKIPTYVPTLQGKWTSDRCRGLRE